MHFYVSVHFFLVFFYGSVHIFLGFYRRVYFATSFQFSILFTCNFTVGTKPRLSRNTHVFLLFSTGTCGQDPMLLPLFYYYFFFKMLSPPPPFFFFSIDFFHINNILQLSMYVCYILKKKKIIIK